MTMRLSEWRAAAPHKDAAGPRVSAVVDPVLAALGSGPDPHAWVAWGEEPSIRHTILVPTDPGLIVAFVRVLVPGEGPHASAKLVRWNRVAVGELAVEAQAGHRLLSFQVEQQVLRGVDDEADRVAAFALRLIAAMDGRPLPPVEEAARARGRPARAAAVGAGAGSGRAAGGSAAGGRTTARPRPAASTAAPAPSAKRVTPKARG
jgi:hypothetical protein